MTKADTISIPYPIIDSKEEASMKELTKRYEKLTKPGVLAKTGSRVLEAIPEPIKNVGNNAKNAITEGELFAQCMKVVADGFGTLEKQAAKFTIRESTIAGAGYVFKLIAQQSAKFLSAVWPGAGLAVSSSVAAVGTSAIGKAAIAYYLLY